MTPPTGYTRAERIAGGVVKVPLRYVGDVELPEQIVGLGDVTILTLGEAEDSEHWKVIGPGDLGSNEAAAVKAANAAEKPKTLVRA